VVSVVALTELLPDDVVRVLVDPQPHAELVAVGERFPPRQPAGGELSAAVLADREDVESRCSASLRA
jgi:hypothetical protein